MIVIIISKIGLFLISDEVGLINEDERREARDENQ